MAGDSVEGDGGDEQPSRCRICLFVALLLAQVASLKVFARFLGGGASCASEDGGTMTVGVAGPAATGLVTTGPQCRQG